PRDVLRGIICKHHRSCGHCPIMQRALASNGAAQDGELVFQSDLLKHRAIFLSGGGTGLGRSMALHFASLGAKMFVIGRREDPLKETCEEIRRTGGAASYTTCDVRDFASVEAAADKADAEFGRIDTVINN